MEFIGAVALAFGAVFVAEFGDKSQLLILAFATRYPWRPIVLGARRTLRPGRRLPRLRRSVDPMCT